MSLKEEEDGKTEKWKLFLSLLLFKPGCDKLSVHDLCVQPTNNRLSKWSFLLTYIYMCVCVYVPTRENGQVLAEWFHNVSCQLTMHPVSLVTGSWHPPPSSTPSRSGWCMEVVKWLKYIVKTEISKKEILLSLSLSVLDPQSPSLSLYMPLSSNLTSTEWQKLYPILSFLLTTQPAKKLEILYYDATTTSITEGRMRLHRKVSVKSVINIFATLCC